MSLLKKRWLVGLSASCLVISAASGQGVSDTGAKVVEVTTPSAGVSDQMRMDQMAMKQMMKSQEMMTKAKDELMGDEKMAERVAKEILMQEMVKDPQYLAMVREGLRSDTENDPKMKTLVEKISAAKAKMLKDKDAMMSMTQELMVRQIAANRIAMMNGGRFDAEAVKKLDDEKKQTR